eukprot:105639-Amphidinium_carterae.1
MSRAQHPSRDPPHAIKMIADSLRIYPKPKYGLNGAIEARPSFFRSMFRDLKQGMTEIPEDPVLEVLADDDHKAPNDELASIYKFLNPPSLLAWSSHLFSATLVLQCLVTRYLGGSAFIPGKDCDEDDDIEEMLEYIMDSDHDIAMSIRTQLIPYAVRWYTGEATPEGFDDEDEEEDF